MPAADRVPADRPARPIITMVLTPTADHRAERELRSTVRVEGFLAPTGDRREHTFIAGMYSGKRHRCGFNIQVVGSTHGTLIMVGQPQPGAMHDNRAWPDSGLADLFDGRLHADGGPGGFADTAYTGTGLSVPRRKPAGQDHTESAREYNRAIASRRASVERVIAHLKTGNSSPPATAACRSARGDPGTHCSRPRARLTFHDREPSQVSQGLPIRG